MKTYITILLLAVALVGVALIGMERAFDERCRYYLSLPSPTSGMVEMCE